MPKIRHVYALFDSLDAALAALTEVQARGCATEHCSAMLHERHIDSIRLPTGERASLEGAAKGATLGGTVGAVLGGLAALGGGIVGIGPLAAAAFAGGVLAAYGAVLGGIAGGDEPDHRLRVLQENVEGGKVLIALETNDPALRAMSEEVFAKHGGHGATP